MKLLNHLDLFHTYQEESSKDLSVLYAETVYVLWQRSKETEAKGNPDVGPHIGDHTSFSPAALMWPLKNLQCCVENRSLN